MTPLPAYIDQELWTDFIEGRKEMQKQKIPFTAVAQKRLLMKCMKLHDDGFDVNQCLEEAICNCWRSVFPPKGAQKAQQAASFAQSDRQAGWARWEAQTGRIHPDRQAAAQSFIFENVPQPSLENWNGTPHQSH